MPLSKLNFLFDNNPNPMWIFELATLKILKVNTAAIHRYGYSEDEFLTMTTRDLRPAEDIPAFDEFLLKNDITNPSYKGITFSGIWKHKRKDGEIIYADISTHNLLFNETDCRIVVATDATEKLQYQQAVHLREQELIWTKTSLEALINNTQDQIWSVDRDTRYVYMNKAYRESIAKLTGVEPREGDLANDFAGYSAQTIKKWQKHYNKALKGQRYTIINESIEPDSKNLLSFEISFNPIYKTKGEITGVGCFARNITERLKTEKAIIDQNERLRQIASLTSHELRRPVASMLGLINIMDRGNFFNPDNKEIIEHLLTVGNEIDEVIRLIVDKTFTEVISQNISDAEDI